MKNTGIIRKTDELGRFVLPKELRDSLKIGCHELLDIHVDGKIIMIQKHTPSCAFCGSEDDVQQFKDGVLCSSCRSELLAG